jgi:uncharacterized protein YjbI with pentapeptide repeats
MRSLASVFRAYFRIPTSAVPIVHFQLVAVHADVFADFVEAGDTFFAGCDAVRTAKVRTAKVRTAKVRTAKVRIAKVRTAKVRIAKVRIAKVRIAKVRTAKVRTAKVRTAKVRTAKVRIAKVRTAKVRIAKVRTAKVRIAKVRTAKVRTAKVRTAKVRTAKVRIALSGFYDTLPYGVALSGKYLGTCPAVFDCVFHGWFLKPGCGRSDWPQSRASKEYGKFQRELVCMV